MYLETKKLKTLLPYIGSFFILCGYLKLSLFYHHFNIKITEYLELTEIISLFIGDAMLYIAIVFLVNLYSFINQDLSQSIENENRQDEILNTEDASLRLKKFLNMRKEQLGAIAAITILNAILIYFKVQNSILVMMNIILIAWVIATYILYEFRRKYKLVYNKDLNITYYNLILSLNLFLVYIFSSIYVDINFTEKLNNNVIKFNYKENVITTDKNILFIGETKNFLFLFNNKQKKTSVYPRNEISNFEIFEKTNKK